MDWRIAKGSARELALDWDNRTIRAVMVRMRGPTVHVVRAAAIAVPPTVKVQDPEAFGPFLREALDRAGMTVRQAVICVPRDRVVLNTLNVPPTSNDELPSLIQFQIVKELPFGPDEATLDFCARGGSPMESRDVLVAAVPNEVLNQYRAVAEKAGLKLARIGLRPDANLLAVMTNAAELAQGQVLMVDIGPELTEINIISGGRLVFSRAAVVRLPAELMEPILGDTRLDDSRIIKAPLPDVPPAPALVQGVVDDVLLEVTRSVEAYRATAAGMAIDRIILAGATGVEDSVAEALGARFGAATELYNPGRAIELTPARARELRGFSAALGLAMGEGQPPLVRIDFLTPKKTVPRRARQIQRLRLAVLTAAVLLLAAYVWFNRMLVQPQEALIAAVEKEVNTLVAGTKDYANFQKKQKSVEDWVTGERIFADELVQLTRAFPDFKEMYALSILQACGAPTDVRLRSRDQTVAPALIKRLKQTGSFDASLEGSLEQSQKDGFHFTERMKVTFIAAKAHAPGTHKPAPPASTAPAVSGPTIPISGVSAPAVAAPTETPASAPVSAPMPATAPSANPNPTQPHSTPSQKAAPSSAAPARPPATKLPLGLPPRPANGRPSPAAGGAK